jgi:4-hydroxy-3-methylbut-2-en-1-yl diphosphate reductase
LDLARPCLAGIPSLQQDRTKHVNETLSTFHRTGFGLKEAVKPELKQEYDSTLITELRSNGNVLQRGDVTIRLAEAFGFCWGVDRAVSMAYETRRYFPDRSIWITNEIIHNPLVNSRLKEMGIKFISIAKNGQKDFSVVAAGDVVILPAFGVSTAEMQLLESKSCEIVDTTCPWVSRVWNRVIKYEQSEFTAIIHGKWRHEETIATSSRCKHYLIVQNLEEAQWACDYILGLFSREQFLQKFQHAYSDEFDPDQHLKKVGIANQTTMLKGETEQIAKLFEKTILRKYGPSKLDEHFLSPGDTICDATQERQDAMFAMIKEPLDVILVIGGYNSSNTGHLYEIAAEKGTPAYHIDGHSRIDLDNSIQHYNHSSHESMVTQPWLPEGSITIGITAGASTPDQVVAECIEKILKIRERSGPRSSC